MFGLFRKRTTTKGFWPWLAANTSRIQTGGGEAIPAMGKAIGRAFDAAYDGLTWEITPAKSGPWLFCISADGNADLFPRVEESVRAAPEIPGWRVQAFRSRGSLDVVLEMGDRQLSYDDIWCSVAREPGGLAVTLWVRGLDEHTDPALSGAAAVLLDNAVGEYDAVKKIARLDRGPLPPNPQETATFFPLALLPSYLDTVVGS